MPQSFSRRTAWDTSSSALAEVVSEARRDGRRLFDLTQSNPTVCGFEYDAELILVPLADGRGLAYNPDPRGLTSARQAIVTYYAGHDAAVCADEILLTTGTSEAYSFLFRLLCDPGDAVLVALPGYPLFDFVAALDDVELKTYPLFYDFGWWIDFAELERRITPCTRAILLVHPNNPTGHATPASERAKLEAICARHDLALIVDEVFLDFAVDPACSLASFAAGDHPVLTFVVSGLSKIAALPQMKVAWIACFGPAALRGEAYARLELIADTFLSVSTPAQMALPQWLVRSDSMATQIRARVRANLATLSELGFPHLSVQAGWNVILRLPQRVAGDDLAQTLVQECSVMVHPGSFYGVAGGHHVVASLIVPEEEFRGGVTALQRWCEASAGQELWSSDAHGSS